MSRPKYWRNFRTTDAVCTRTQGTGLISYSKKRNMSVSGSKVQYAKYTMNECDLMIAIGAEAFVNGDSSRNIVSY